MRRLARISARAVAKTAVTRGIWSNKFRTYLLFGVWSRLGIDWAGVRFRVKVTSSKPMCSSEC